MAKPPQEMAPAHSNSTLAPSSSRVGRGKVERQAAPPDEEARDGRWRKVLWEAQEFPDNHVDATFLASLVTNGEHRRNKSHHLHVCGM